MYDRLMHAPNVTADQVITTLHSHGKLFLVVIKQTCVWDDDKWYLIS